MAFCVAGKEISQKRSEITKKNISILINAVWRFWGWKIAKNWHFCGELTELRNFPLLWPLVRGGAVDHLLYFYHLLYPER